MASSLLQSGGYDSYVLKSNNKFGDYGIEGFLLLIRRKSARGNRLCEGK